MDASACILQTTSPCTTAAAYRDVVALLTEWQCDKMYWPVFTCVAEHTCALDRQVRSIQAEGDERRPCREANCHAPGDEPPHGAVIFIAAAPMTSGAQPRPTVAVCPGALHRGDPNTSTTHDVLLVSSDHAVSSAEHCAVSTAEHCIGQFDRFDVATEGQLGRIDAWSDRRCRSSQQAVTGSAAAQPTVSSDEYCEARRIDNSDSDGLLCEYCEWLFESVRSGDGHYESLRLS